MSPSTTDDRWTVAKPPSLPAPLKAGAFWTAVLMPFLALGVLASGLGSPLEYLAFTALLVANVLALVAGHDYGQ